MSIFSRSSNEPPPSVAPNSPASRPKPPSAGRADLTHIADGSKVVGDISGATQLHIDGIVEGQISLESHVEIGAKGRVKGEVYAKSVKIGGQVQGNVTGVERVEVLSSGRLQGDVVSPRVAIAEGALCNGKVVMTDKVGKPPSGGGSSKSSAGSDSAKTSSPPATQHSDPRNPDTKKIGGGPPATGSPSGGPPPKGGK